MRSSPPALHGVAAGTAAFIALMWFRPWLAWFAFCVVGLATTHATHQLRARRVLAPSADDDEPPPPVGTWVWDFDDTDRGRNTTWPTGDKVYDSAREHFV